jgi:hypothetical protein
MILRLAQRVLFPRSTFVSHFSHKAWNRLEVDRWISYGFRPVEKTFADRYAHIALERFSDHRPLSSAS